MGATSSKTANRSSTPSSFVPSSRRISKRMLMRNSAVYPKPVDSNAYITTESNNNNKQIVIEKESTVVLRNMANVELSNESLSNSTPKSAKKERKKKKSDVALSGEDSVSTYHQTAVTSFCPKWIVCCTQISFFHSEGLLLQSRERKIS